MVATTNALNMSARLQEKELDLDTLSKLINISGRQRMLSQRIAFLIIAKEKVATEKIEEAFKLFESSHKLLKSGSEVFPPPSKGSEIEEYFFGDKEADKKITTYIKFAKELYSGKRNDLQEFIDLASSEIVPLLNDAVVIYEKYSHALSMKMNEKMTKNNENLIKTFEEVQEVHSRIKVISVNASILAAQAGQFGDTFNVVVREIRDLAGIINTLVSEGLSKLKKSN